MASREPLGYTSSSRPVRIPDRWSYGRNSPSRRNDRSREERTRERREEHREQKKGRSQVSRTGTSTNVCPQSRRSDRSREESIREQKERSQVSCTEQEPARYPRRSCSRPPKRYSDQQYSSGRSKYPRQCSSRPPERYVDHQYSSDERQEEVFSRRSNQSQPESRNKEVFSRRSNQSQLESRNTDTPNYLRTSSSRSRRASTVPPRSEPSRPPSRIRHEHDGRELRRSARISERNYNKSKSRDEWDEEVFNHRASTPSSAPSGSGHDDMSEHESRNNDTPLSTLNEWEDLVFNHSTISAFTAPSGNGHDDMSEHDSRNNDTPLSTSRSPNPDAYYQPNWNQYQPSAFNQYGLPNPAAYNSGNWNQYQASAFNQYGLSNPAAYNQPNWNRYQSTTVFNQYGSPNPDAYYQPNWNQYQPSAFNQYGLSNPAAYNPGNWNQYQPSAFNQYGDEDDDDDDDCVNSENIDDHNQENALQLYGAPEGEVVGWTGRGVNIPNFQAAIYHYESHTHRIVTNSQDQNLSVTHRDAQLSAQFNQRDVFLTKIVLPDGGVIFFRGDIELVNEV